ncbi:hypothetical protein DEI83_07670 [Curtobacterium sp. MCBD17_021]|nr:hypothetical protein DEI83_07670 [Curtobacterium sp. MCBD17_021]
MRRLGDAIGRSPGLWSRRQCAGTGPGGRRAACRPRPTATGRRSARPRPAARLRRRSARPRSAARRRA